MSGTAGSSSVWRRETERRNPPECTGISCKAFFFQPFKKEEKKRTRWRGYAFCLGREECSAAAATVSAAIAAAAVVPAAAPAAAAAAAEENDNQNDDPQAAAAAPSVIATTHISLPPT